MQIISSHVLICRTDNIGDIVLTLPITAWLKQHFPSIKISLMCRAYAASVARRCATVDHVIEVESFLSDPAAFYANSDIDTVIFAQPDRQLVMEAFKARIPNRIGNARQKLYLLLFCNRRIRFSKRISPLHETQFNFEFLRPFGLDNIPELAAIPALFDFNVPRDDEIERLLRPHPFNLIIHTKSNGHGREWPIEHYQALAEYLSAHPDIHVWATGSAGEGQWLEQNAAGLLRLPNVSNVSGKFTLDRLMSFIRSADGLIASGTGPLHLSAALGQRTLGLFPPTRPMHPGRWAPIGVRGQFLCQPVGCSACEQKKTISCDCMQAITPASVAEIVMQWHAEIEANAVAVS
ncbi:MAG: ADP-heptose--lipooligosaccharide heptosyltransferase [Herbaspirillum sp.]|nr:ADP-heptose--lipooligosaccharide heptosyltransferase [Herbaspirillum sp.]